jgi:hypothetical protein
MTWRSVRAREARGRVPGEVARSSGPQKVPAGTQKTGGLGLAFKRFQIDLGIDVSDPVNTASISAIYSF